MSADEYRRMLSSALDEKTSSAVGAASGEISMADFVGVYADFYYSYALDGHEADAEEAQILWELRQQVEFHRRVQEEVVDRVFFKKESEMGWPIPATRITPEEGRRVLQTLINESM